MQRVDVNDLYDWCRIPVEELGRKQTKVPFRIVADSTAMGELMARELIDDIQRAQHEGRTFRVIIPCGPKSWYAPFTRIVNEEYVSLKHVIVFHMDECLDWEGNSLPAGHPCNFKWFMETYFYGGIPSELEVPVNQRYFPNSANMEEIKQAIDAAPIDLCIGGFGQDGHIAYNQAPRHPYHPMTVEQLRRSRLRMQDNNLDTVMALAHRNFGGAYQFVPPMSVTLGLHECLGAKAVRLYSDTGAWKQTAFRVALFSEEVVEYPITLLQSHPNARITVSYDTADHAVIHEQGQLLWGKK